MRLERSNNKVLQKALKFYETLLRLSKDGILITDGSRNIIEVNDIFCSFIGQNRKKVIGSNLIKLLKIFSEDASENWIKLQKEVKSKHIVSNYEFQLFMKKEIRHFNVNASLLEKTENEEQNGIISIWHDITENKKTEEALKESEEKFRLIAENTSDNIGITTFDLKAKYIYASSSVKSLLGYDPEDLLEKSFFDFIHPKDKKKLIPLLKKYIGYKLKKLITGKESDYSETIEFRFKNKIGNWRFMQSTVNIVGNQILAVTRDITERIRAEEVLKESEEKLSTILNSMPDIVLQLDTKLKILWANEAAIRINPKAVGQPCYKALSGRNIPCPDCPIIKALKTGQIERGVAHLKSVSGIGESYWDDIGIPVKDTQGEIVSIVKLARNVTDKKKAEEEIRKLSKVVETTPEAVVITDMQGKIEYVNRGLLSLGGFKDNKSIIGKSIFMFSNKEGEKQLKKEIIPTILSEGKWKGEVPVKRKDDSVFPADMVCSVVPDEECKPKYLLSQYHDITKRKEVEEELWESEQRFRKLFENVPTVAVQGYNPDGEIHYWNKANEFIYGYTAEEAIGKNLVDLIIPSEMKEDVKKIIKKGVKTGKMPPATEITLMRKDGKPVTVFSSHALVQQSGKEPELFCIDVDLTERKQAEEAIQKSEEKYRLLAENSIDMVWQMDLKLVFTYVSPSVKNIMGYTVEEWVGSKLSQHSGTKDFFEMAKKAIYAIKHYKEFKHLTFDSVMLRKDGTEIPVEITGKLILNKKGFPVGLQGTTRDITERKKAEKEIIRLKDGLEVQVAGKTKELNEKVAELERFYDATIEREFRIKELNDRIEELEAKLKKEN